MAISGMSSWPRLARREIPQSAGVREGGQQALRLVSQDDCPGERFLVVGFCFRAGVEVPGVRIRHAGFVLGCARQLAIDTGSF